MKQIGSFFLLFITLLAIAIACTRPQLSPDQAVPLPPTTTPISAVRETAVVVISRPDSSPSPTATMTATQTINPPVSVTTYTIQPGDTLAIISSRFEVSVEEISEVNNLPNPDTITAGETLLIPQQIEATVVTPTGTPPPTNTPLPEATADSETGGGTPTPPDELAPTGRLELTHPHTMVVEESSVITVEIIADPELAAIGEHEPHITGVVRLDASYTDGERAFYEQTVELFPLMSAELNAPAFDVFPSGGDNVRLPRVISTTLPAVWTWDIIAASPGEAQVITLNLYKEPTSENSPPVLTQSISRNIEVMAKGRWSQIIDSLADNVLVLLGTGGPLGLLLAYLTFRTSKENERLKKQLAAREKSRVLPKVENENQESG